MPGGSKHEDSGLPLGLEGGPEVWQSKAPKKTKVMVKIPQKPTKLQNIQFSLEINYNNKVRQKSTVIDFVVYNC